MKKYILYALSLMALCSCVVDSGDWNEYSQSGLERFASEVAEDKFLYPLSVFETVLLIQDYEDLGAEEKVEFKHIFNSLIKVSEDVYKMEQFFNLRLSTDGKSIYEKGAEWAFQTDYSLYNYSSSPISFRLCSSPEREGCDFLLEADIKSSADMFLINKVEDEDAYFSWSIGMEGAFESEKGRVVYFRTDGPVTRKVTRSSDSVAESMVTMNGRIVITISDTDGTLLDEVTYNLSGTKENHYYQF